MCRRYIPIVLALVLIAGAATAKVMARMDTGLEGLMAARPQIAGAPLGDLEGKIVLVTFFASWCPPCKWEFEALNRLRRSYPAEDLAIVAVNWFEYWGNYADGKRMGRFLASTKPEFTVIEGDEAISERFGGITRIPSLFVFDRNGRSAFRFIHLEGAEKAHMGHDELVRVIDALR